MPRVANALMYAVMKQIQSDVRSLKEDQPDHSAALNSIRGHMLAMQNDITNIRSILVRHDDRLDRIERRLDLVDAH